MPLKRTQPRTPFRPAGHSWPAALALTLLMAAPGSAALSYPGCADLRPADFKQVPLITNGMDASVKEPLKMAFDMDAQGNVDVYFTQRFGLLRKYSVARKSLVTLADFAFSATQVPIGRNSFGLIGVALDPGFKSNRWIYLYIGLAREWKISRYVVNGDKVDLATEKVIFRLDPGPTVGITHVAGALRFDAGGNLWATVADNELPAQSANTNSYLGKIIRIRPLPIPDAGSAPAPGAGSTYEIPNGNLYPRETAKTLPEIYVMGARNPYTLALDPVRNAVAWGDIGPDVPQVGTGTEEFNFTTEPGNFGYPFWAGNQYRLEAGRGTPEAPVNNRADNTGLAELKPAIPAMIPYPRDCAVTGPVYYYDAGNKNPLKLPPHLDGAWLVGDFNDSWADAVLLDKAGTKVQSRNPIMTTSPADELSNPLEMQVGPDGILYVINYSGYRTSDAKTGLLRVEYHGDCHPISTASRLAMPAGRVRWNGLRVSVDEAGPHSVALRNLSGRTEILRKGLGPAEYDLRAFPGRGVRLVEIVTPSGRVRKSLVYAP